MGRLTNSIDYCAIHCDFGKRGECFFKDKSKCYEKSIHGKLKAYEDIIDEPEKLKIIDGWYSDLCKENGQLKKELAEYKKLEEEGHLLKLQINTGDTVYEVSEDGIEECVVEVLFIAEYTDKNGIRCSMAEIHYEREDCPYVTNEIYFTDIGKTVFLTKEEAEQALERMKEVQDVN